MGRRPNFATSQWVTSLIRQEADPWNGQGDCSRSPQLPWTAELTPEASELAQMRDICNGCPVRLTCARYAMNANAGHGIDGGMYAGVWIPWASHNESRATKSMRRRARYALRSIVKAA